MVFLARVVEKDRNCRDEDNLYVSFVEDKARLIWTFKLRDPTTRERSFGGDKLGLEVEARL